MYSLADFDLYYYAIPMNAPFRGITLREGVILRGPHGWGDFCPFDNYDDFFATRWLRAAIESATTPFPQPTREYISINAIIPATSPQDAYERTLLSGSNTAKVKISDNSSSLHDDIRRLQAVRKALGPHGKIRLDINGLWDVRQAISQLPILISAAEGIDYVEQPCPLADDLRRIKESVDVVIAADEIIRLAHDPLDLHLEGIADIAIIKVTPLNGISYCLSLANQLNMPIVVSSALETSVGFQAGLFFASIIPNLAGACGFGTLSLFTGDITATPLAPINGVTKVEKIDADIDLLHFFSNTDPDRVTWWKNRLIRCMQILFPDQT